MKTTYRLGELFCGPGGIALGAKMASEQNESAGYSITHAWATDYDKDICKTYSKNICGAENSKTVVHEDIRKLDITRLEKISDWFLAENVGGLRNSNDGSAFQTILEKMEEAGYRTVPHLYKFEQYGAPQARE